MELVQTDINGLKFIFLIVNFVVFKFDTLSSRGGRLCCYDVNDLCIKQQPADLMTVEIGTICDSNQRLC